MNRACLEDEPNMNRPDAAVTAGRGAVLALRRMTYRSKIAAVIGFAALAVMLAVGLSVWTIQSTDRHIRQANVAQSLLTEHLQLSVHAYRLFKQLTDEILLGSAANQSVVRNKRQAIAESLDRIRRLELVQRRALGAEAVPGAVEDTDELEAAIELIIRDFQVALQLPPGPERSSRVDAILEERIDVGFRDRVNTALERQRDVVDSMNNRIHTVHARSMGVSVALVLATVLVGLGLGWLLVRGIASPLDTLRTAAETWSQGDFAHKIPASADGEFNRITRTFNDMADGLAEFAQQSEQTEQELQAAVAARTAELSAANQALRRADEVRRHFFADVSHELRTPLTVIRGEAQVALREQARSGEEYRDALGIVLEQAVGLSRLVDDMLFIARTDAERIRLMRQPIELDRLFEAVRRETAGLAAQRDVALETSVDPQVAELVADPDRIRQLLIILIDNAIRFSPAGAVVHICARLQGDQVALSVSDSGPGIDSQDLPYIFDRFFRGAGNAGADRGAGKGSTSGLGLGLAVAKAIVTAHGGTIAGASPPGEGTTITATLPRQ